MGHCAEPSKDYEHGATTGIINCILCTYLLQLAALNWNNNLQPKLYYFSGEEILSWTDADGGRSISRNKFCP